VPWASRMWRRRLTTGPAHPWKVCVSIRKVATKKVGLAGGMGRAMWLGVAMLSSSDYLDGVLGRLNLLFLCASESICFRALS
jgi:hypothetical protein